MMILVVFLNHTKLRCTIPGRAYILLNGALILFCFRFFFMVVGNTIHLVTVTNLTEKQLIKNYSMLSVRIVSYGCTREVWRTQKKRKKV